MACIRGGARFSELAQLGVQIEWLSIYRSYHLFIKFIHRKRLDLRESHGSFCCRLEVGSGPLDTFAHRRQWWRIKSDTWP